MERLAKQRRVARPARASRVKLAMAAAVAGAQASWRGEMNAWALSMPSRARPTVMPARAAAAAAVGARRDRRAATG